EKAFKLIESDWRKATASKSKPIVRFYLPLKPENPDDPVWTVIRKLSAKIGEQLTTHLRAIAKENPFAGISLSPLHNCPFSLEIAFATRRHIAGGASLRRRLLCLKSRPWCAPREARFETHAHHRHALRWARRTSGASRRDSRTKEG